MACFGNCPQCIPSNQQGNVNNMNQRMSFTGDQHRKDVGVSRKRKYRHGYSGKIPKYMHSK